MVIANIHKIFKMNIVEIGTDLLNFLGQAWWIEIETLQPKCTYFFGPFINRNVANLSISGYLEDLESESALGIKTYIKRCKPTVLTIDEDFGLQTN
jgi:Domain of unknown function (DUF1816)